MRRPTAASNGAPSAVKQRQPHAVAGTDGDDVLLRTVQRPIGAQAAGILRGIGITNHHFLMTAEPVPVPRDREQIAHDGAGMLQIAQRLEERHDTLRVRRAGRRL